MKLPIILLTRCLLRMQKARPRYGENGRQIISKKEKQSKSTPRRPDPASFSSDGFRRNRLCSLFFTTSRRNLQFYKSHRVASSYIPSLKGCRSPAAIVFVCCHDCTQSVYDRNEFFPFKFNIINIIAVKRIIISTLLSIFSFRAVIITIISCVFFEINNNCQRQLLSD